MSKMPFQPVFYTVRQFFQFTWRWQIRAFFENFRLVWFTENCENLTGWECQFSYIFFIKRNRNIHRLTLAESHAYDCSGIPNKIICTYHYSILYEVSNHTIMIQQFWQSAFHACQVEKVHISKSNRTAVCMIIITKDNHKMPVLQLFIIFLSGFNDNGQSFVLIIIFHNIPLIKKLPLKATF